MRTQCWETKGAFGRGNFVAPSKAQLVSLKDRAINFTNGGVQAERI